MSQNTHGDRVEHLPVFLEYQRQYFYERGWKPEIEASDSRQRGSSLPEILVFRNEQGESQLASYPGQIMAKSGFDSGDMSSLASLVRHSGVDRANLVLPVNLECREAGNAAGALGWKHAGFLCDLRIDLSVSAEKIFENFRKKYRQQIRKHSPAVTVCVNTKPEGVSLLQSLHRRVSGRVTRSNKTWDLMRSATIAGQGFTVLSTLPEEKLVGALYVMHSDSHALAFSAAYDREVMARGLPLGHLCEWNAIKYLAENSTTSSYSTLVFPASWAILAKQAAILQFKEGLGATHHLMERFEYRRLVGVL